MTRFLLLLAAAVPLYSQPLAHIPLPAELKGTLQGSPYRIVVPANWNGVALVFLHGLYLAPPPFVEVAPQTFPAASPSLENQLLSLGYALAGVSFPNSEEEGIRQTHALTSLFNGEVGHARRVIVWGGSFGGLLAVMLIEKYAGIYDGSIVFSSALAGNSKFMDAALRTSVAYAAAFGWPSDRWGPIGDLRDDLDFSRDFLPVVQWPTGIDGRWEFIRLVLQQQPPAFWLPDPGFGISGLAYQMYFATVYRSRLERENGGPIAQNPGAVYTLTDTEKSYLSGLGVNPNAMLASMNAQANIAARKSARNHLEHYGNPSGDLRRPVVTVHASMDGATWVTHESAFRSVVEAAGRSRNLVQAYINSPVPIHGTLTVEQYLAALTALQYWLDTGMRPDTSFFPASKGFDSGYVPPAWPF